ncbi:MAG: hypothetical protein EOP49_40410, partial [Sphingobacteriales bacterium]
MYQHSAPAELKNFFITPTRTLLLVFSPASSARQTGGKPEQNELIELWPTGTVRRRQQIPTHLHPIWVDPQGTIYLAQFRNINETQSVPQPHLTEKRLENVLYRLDSDGVLTDVPLWFEKNPFHDPTHYHFISNQMVYDPKHGLFWFLGKTELFAWHPQHGIVFNLAASGFPASSLSALYQLFIDHTGAIWLGTQNGFLLLTVERNHFQRYFYSLDEDKVQPKFSTRGMAKMGNWLWINVDGGRMMNLQTGQIRTVEFEGYAPVIQGHDHRIWTILPDSLLQIDPSTRAIRTFPLNSSQASTSYCWSLWQDQGHNFWMGFDEGLAYFNLKQKRTYSFTGYNQYRELAKNRVNGFFPDASANGIWVAASSGLYLLDTLRGITARFSS